MDDGFSMDLSGGNYAFQYKPDFVSPLADRFVPGIAKPDFVSPLDANYSRFMQGRTAAALGAAEVTADQLGGCESCSDGLGIVGPSDYGRGVMMPYKQGNVSPIAYRMAPFSLKPDFVSSLEPRGNQSTRFLQDRTAAALAAIPSARESYVNSLPGNTRKSLTPSDLNPSGNEYDISDDSGFIVNQEDTFFKNSDGSWKTAKIAGTAAAVGLVAFLAFR